MDRGMAGVLLGCVLAWGASLWWWDRRHGRLPDALTLPAAALVVLASCWGGHPFAVLGGLVWAGAYALLAVISRGGIGGGDVKLALSLGTAAAWGGGVAAVLGAVLIANALAVGEMLWRRSARHAHGPAMLLGTALSLGIMFVLVGVEGLWAGYYASLTSR